MIRRQVQGNRCSIRVSIRVNTRFTIMVSIRVSIRVNTRVTIMVSIRVSIRFIIKG